MGPTDLFQLAAGMVWFALTAWAWYFARAAAFGDRAAVRRLRRACRLMVGKAWWAAGLSVWCAVLDQRLGTGFWAVVAIISAATASVCGMRLRMYERYLSEKAPRVTTRVFFASRDRVPDLGLRVHRDDGPDVLERSDVDG